MTYASLLNKSSALGARFLAASLLVVGVPAHAAVLWSADMENGNLTKWSENYGGGEYNSGVFTSGASRDFAHTGSYSAKTTITTPTASGVRYFRWAESRANRGAYYSAWFYIPQDYVLTADPHVGQFWMLMQFKSTIPDRSRNDPLWGFYADRDSDGQFRMRTGWGWGGTNVAGPYANSNLSGKNYYQTIKTLPIGQWFHLEAYLYQSKDFDGRVTLWQDGVQLFDFQNVRTAYDNANYNTWRTNNEWAVNNYSDGISPSPSALYIDDAVISTTRVGQTGSDTIPPSAPTNLRATVVSSSQVNVTWSPSTDNTAVSSYRIERCKGKNCTSFSQIGSTASVSFSDTTVSRKSSYSYRVRATDPSANLSPYSPIATAVTPGLTRAAFFSSFIANLSQMMNSLFQLDR